MPPKRKGSRQSGLSIKDLLRKVRKLEGQLHTLQEKYENCLQSLEKLEEENVRLKNKLQRIEGKADNDVPTTRNCETEEVKEENEDGIVSDYSDTAEASGDDYESQEEDNNGQLSELTNAETWLQKGIVQFLDEMATKKCPRPKSSMMPKINCELDSFRTVLKRKLNSMMKGMEEYHIEEGHPRRKTILEYYPAKPVPQQEEAANASQRSTSEDDSMSGLMDEEVQVGDVFERGRKSTEKGSTSQSKKNITKTFPCNQCGSCFGSKTQLERHMITHSSDYQHPCPHCGQLFKRKDDVPKHVRWKHENTRKFSCSMCSKTFVDASGLRRHERRHLGIKPHLCSECGKAFPESSNLKKHIASQHGTTVQSNKVPIHVS